jgi:hypothetical protein
MSDARARQDEIGARPIEPPLGQALTALRAGDLDSFSDWLHEVRFPTSTVGIASMRTIAEVIVTERLDAGFAPSASIDEIAATLAGRSGLRGGDFGGASTSPPSVSPTTDTSTVSHQLAAARAEIARLRAERDALEAKVDELAGARVLADALATELERDEWLRARLRRLKDTRAARAIIYVRRRLRAGTRSAASR